MRKIILNYNFLIILISVLLLPGCHFKREPSVKTSPVTEIGPNTAITGGEVTSDGYVDVIVRGVCYGTKKSPGIDGDRTTDGYGEGPFTSTLTNLTPNTQYFVRAYAINAEGTGYGEQLTFTTSKFGVPTLTTSAVTLITQTTAISGGNITSDGGVEVTARGVCWSTHAVPTISDSKTINGTGSGSFTSSITGLTGNTTYYVRAYATNSEGTAYGQEISFRTSPVLPQVTTDAPSATGTATGTGGGNVTNDGGAAITARGVCWNTSPNPTVANSKTSDGTGTGTFVSSITGLLANTTYHVRAYATNSVGTSYGSDLVFTTDPVTVSDNDGNTYNVIRIDGQVWMKENLKTTRLNDNSAIPNVTNAGTWSTLTTGAYVWFNNDVANKNTYGALYNWHAVNSGKLCPAGWHVASDEDWLTLVAKLGGEDVAGGKLKETGTTHWTSPNTGATNESNFTALPGGWRRGDNGSFESLATFGYWWTSTSLSPSSWFRKTGYNEARIFRDLIDPKYGMSVRCIKN
jgi:uncharacterized protein (TIGR02145 family)